ncbi:MAG: DNA mismatch repair endonuclease MutL [Candidatus Bipolaricaulota bacterium]|nr:DNA mismatch repair endonuclease MutL [Candidatus Bipolaricaulota bacterium]
MPIQRLAEELSQKIAAGEVIDRPVSVVKELMENAIDAGSHQIGIDLRAGGLAEIVVRDDGCGMTVEDLRLCGERHATSKIRSVEDLGALRTLGFRGEALASVAAVAHVRLVSRAAGANEAYGLALSPSGAEEPLPDSRGPGTTVQVRDLFFNLPARAKFMEAPRTEALHINRLVQRFALMLPDVGFVLSHDGREAFAAPRVRTLLERIGQVYGADVARGMIPLDGRRGAIRVSGCISHRDVKRGNRRDQLFVVNRRSVNDHGLGYILAGAYSGILRPGSFPIAVLCVDLPPDQVDVNIHPRKEEVRFANSREVQDAVAAALHQALTSPSMMGRIPLGGREEPPDTESFAGGGVQMVRDAAAARPLSLGLPMSTTTSREPEKVGLASERRVVGQLHDMYLLVETVTGLEIVDQHIAHERILYERLRREFGDSGIVRQLFLLPARIELPFEAAEIVGAGLARLERAGVVLEEFGGGTFLLREYPQALADEQTPRGFQGVIDALVDVLREEGDVEEALFDGILTELACAAAIKAGDRIPLVEAQALVDQLMQQANPYSCPHGRPIVFAIDRAELDRRFGR